MNEISIRSFASLLWDLGYSVNFRGNVVEGIYYNSHIKVSLSRNLIRIESNDYGPRCLNDLAKIVNSLRLRGYRPKLIILKSPYIISLEKERGETAKLLSKLGLKINTVYNGFCG